MLERESELASIERVVQAAISGNGGVAVVEGHAGVGKTLLLEAAIDRARDLGVEILTARGVETEQEFAFGVVLQLLQRRVLTAPAPERDEVLSGAAALAAPLLQGTKLVGIEGPEAAFATYHGLYWVVANLAERAPIALVVDDAHWADAASLRFLASLSHRLDGLAAAIVLGRRLGEGGVAVGVIDVISQSPSASRVSLRNLSDAAVATLVRARYDDSADDVFCDACSRAARGNPLYLRELLGELSAREVSADARGAELVHDMDVEALGRAVRTRLARAGSAAATLAEAASISNGGMPLRLVAQLADLESKDADELAITLSNADILESGDPVRFVHPLVQNAVYSALAQARKEAMHLKAAEILRDERADAERIAGHLLSCRPQSADWAIDVLLEAAQSAVERAAPDTAVLHLRQALPGAGEDRRHIVLAQLGLAGLASGEPDALDIVREAAALMQTSRERALYLLPASEALFLLRRFEESLQLARASLSEVDEREDEGTAAYVVAYLAGLSAVTRLADRESVRRLPALCDRIVGRGGDPKTAAERLLAGVFAGIITLTGQRSAKEARTLALRALGTAAPEEIRGAMFEAPMALAITEAFDDAERAFGMALDAARRLGLQHNFASGQSGRADARYRAGRLEDAIADAEASLQIGRDTWTEPHTRATLAMSLLDAGDLESAERAIALEQPDRWNTATHICLFHEARGRVHLGGRAFERGLDGFPRRWGSRHIRRRSQSCLLRMALRRCHGGSGTRERRASEGACGRRSRARRCFRREEGARHRATRSRPGGRWAGRFGAAS